MRQEGTGGFLGIRMSFTNGVQSEELTMPPPMDKVPWRTLCEFDENELLTELKLKTFESISGLNSYQSYNGVTLSIRNAREGKDRQIAESWRICGKDATSDLS